MSVNPILNFSIDSLNHPPFKDIKLDSKSYLSTIFKEIWDHFSKGEEDQIIIKIQSNPILLKKRFPVTEREVITKKTIFRLACDFCAEKVATFIINEVDFNYFHISPRNDAIPIKPEDSYKLSPLDDLLNYEDPYKAQFMYSNFLAKTPVCLYKIEKEAILISKTSSQYILSNNLESDTIEGITKKIKQVNKKAHVLIRTPEFIKKLKTDLTYSILDLSDRSPTIFKQCAVMGNRPIFESILGFYCRQDSALFDSIIYEFTKIPSPLASLILQYSTFVINEKVKEIVTLTLANEYERLSSQTKSNPWIIETPFIWTIEGLKTSLSNLSKLISILKRDSTNSSLIDKVNKIKKNILSQIDFAKFLLNCGEDIHRHPNRNLNTKDFPPHFFENLEIMEASDLALQLFNRVEAFVGSSEFQSSFSMVSGTTSPIPASSNKKCVIM